MNLRSLFALTLLAVASLTHAQIKEGVDYTVLSKPVPALGSNKNKIEVLEFFSFTCNHCYNLDTILRKHAKSFPSDIAMRSEQIVWGGQDVTLAKIQSVINQTKTQNQLNPKIFKAIFQDGINLTNDKIFQDWLTKQSSIDTQNFLNAYNSFSTDSDANRMKELTVVHRIDSTPRIIVGGKYEVVLIRDYDTMMKTIDELIAKVRVERNMPESKVTVSPKITSPSVLLGTK